MSAEDLLVFNGIDATTGEYLTRTTDAQLAAIAQGRDPEAATGEHLDELRNRSQQQQFVYADTKDLAQTGWGVIFAHDADPRIREALAPLLEHRRAQATRQHEHFYREYRGYDAETGHGGYLPNETKAEFCQRHGAQVFGPADPHAMPYYLLIVGGPQAIPFSFQYQLDVQYAVGRIAFETLEEYAQYAASVVAAETGPPLKRSAAFFGVRNEDDRSTITSADHLIQPLAGEVLPNRFTALAERERERAQTYRERGNDDLAQQSAALAQVCAEWQQNLGLRLAAQASKSELARLLGGPETPALLFTASHGMGFPKDHELQLRHQGALLCQDWPGPRQHRGAIPADFYFAGEDIGEDARLLGMLAFFFACYGGGTSAYDAYAQATSQQTAIAPHPFVSRLPQRMLAHPKGGALAVVGHVERAWGYSFVWEQQRQLQVFENMLAQLMIDGQPIGAAIEWFNQRYAEISTLLSSAIHGGAEAQDRELARLWTANNDARSYIILGDPAVRLPVGSASDAAAERPTIEPVRLEPRPAPAPQPEPQPTPAAATTERPTPAPQPGSEAVAYGLFDGGVLKEAQENLARMLARVSERVGDTIQHAIDDTSSLEVSTYVSRDMEQVAYDTEQGRFTGGARLRALTRISIDGDTMICLPEGEDGELDLALWQIHTEMVRRAQENRTELLRTAFAAVSGLLDPLKK
jgi:hypothetical protein